MRRHLEAIIIVGAEEPLEGTGDLGLWTRPSPPDEELQTAFTALIEATRRFQDLVTGARPSVADTEAVTRTVERANAVLARYQVDEAHQIAGKQSHLSGRAQSLSPVVYYDETTPNELRTHVTFTRFYLGGNGAVHGGAIPLMFDELLGRLAGSNGRPRTRTAYLNVNFRRITPLDRELQLRGRIDRVEGRKMFLVGTLHDGDNLLCDCEGLFLTLKPGQP